MPNIELHGFGELNGTRLGNQIWDATKDLPFANDMVMRCFKTPCNNRKGEPQLFIRIYSSDEEHYDAILEALKNAGVNEEIETVDIKFYPKEK